MNIEEKKSFTIYYTRVRISLNKEAKTQRGRIEKILKGTPFEEYTTMIFKHLIIVQVLQHGDGEEIETAIGEAKKQLELVSTLLILQKATNFQIKCRYDKETKDKAQCSDIPSELIPPIIKAAIELYNQTLNLCMVPTGETWISEESGEEYNKTKYQPPTIEYLENKQRELQDELLYWGNLKQENGHPTYITGHPNQLSPALRKKCAITIFIKCKNAFDESKWNTAKERNKVIFECLEVMGIASKGETENNINKLIGGAMKLDVSKQYLYKERETKDGTTLPDNIPFIAILKTT